MRKVALLLSVAAASAASLSAQSGQKPATVAQVDQILATERGKSDFSLNDQLAQLVLTERVSTVHLAQWQKDARGPRTRETLIIFADASSFLPLPNAPPLAPPDLKTQGVLMGKAIDYVSKTLPHLPNFLATRSTTQIEDVADVDHTLGGLGYLNKVHPGTTTTEGNSVLHIARHFTVRVAYRDGKEITEAPAKGKKLEVANTGLTTSGEFGPILGLVLSDAIRGSIHWGHWEPGPTAPEAVFAYKVPQAKSHYQVAFPFGGNLQQLTPAYHGEIAIDPATGSVLRLTVIADLDPQYAQVDAAILVEFGPVDIGLHSYICPLKAVAISRLPLTNDPEEAKKPNTPRRTEINDVAFTDYHVFRSTAHILTEEEAQQREAEVPTVAAQTPAPETPATAQPVAPEPPAETAVVTPPPAPLPVAVAPQPVVADADTPLPASFPKIAILHASANLILLDVVITDHDKPVHTLDKKRFHIFENGHEHPITEFSEHGSAPLTVVTPPTLPPNTYSNTPTHAEGSAVTVLFIDGLNTPKINVEDVRRQMIQYLEKVPPGTMVAIFTLSSQLRMVQGFTTNTAPLREALRKLNISAHPGGERLTNDDPGIVSSTAIDMAATGSIPPGMVGMFIRQLQSAADAKVQDIDQRVQLTMDGLQQLARYLSAVPGRKNLIWLSGSFPLALGPTDDVPLNAQADPLKDMRNYEVEVRHTSDLLATARVAVYPIDARGVVETTAFSSGMSATPSVTFGANGQQVNAHRLPTNEANFEHKNMAEGDSMTEIADETGGRTFHGNDFGAAVSNIVNNASSYYTVGYVPTGKLDGGFRNLKVTLDGVHYTLSYRKGYFADDPEHPSEAAKLVSRAHSPLLAATLPGAPPATQILFEAHVLPVTDPQFSGKHLDVGPAGDMSAKLKGPVKRYVAELTVAPSTITFSDQPNGSKRAELEFALVGYDADSSRTNYIERSLQLDFTPEQFAAITSNGLRTRLTLDLPTAPGVLRIAIFDPATLHTGALELPLDSISSSH